MVKIGFVIKEELHVHAKHPLAKEVTIYYNGKEVFKQTYVGNQFVVDQTTRFTIVDVEILLKNIHNKIVEDLKLVTKTL